MNKIADLAAAATALARNQFWIAGGALLLFMGTGVASDQLGNAGTVASAALQLLLQWALLRHVARREGWVGDGDATGGISGLIGMGILKTMGLLLAALLLILPAFYLAARWSASSAILVAEDRAPGDSLGLSWERTRPWAGAIAVANCAIYLPIIGAVLNLALWSDPAADGAATLLLNATAAWATVGSWYLALAVYDRTRIPQIELEQVFA